MPDKDDVGSPVCDRCFAVPGRSGPSWRTTGPPAVTRVGLDLPGDDASDTGWQHRRAGRWIGLSEQIAADLLPEAGDPGVADGGEGL
jgi:hypothetical protein